MARLMLMNTDGNQARSGNARLVTRVTSGDLKTGGRMDDMRVEVGQRLRVQGGRNTT